MGSAREDPRQVYDSRRGALAANVVALERADARVANARLAVFLAAAGIGAAAWGWHVLHGGWLAAPTAIFVALMVLHERTLRRLARARAAVAYYDAGLRRLDGKWQKDGTPGAAPSDDHPFAADLDLFGDGSLFQRLCRARTRAGEQVLARWLAAPDTDTDIDDVGAALAKRHEAIDALRGALGLREQLALVGSMLRAEVEPERLTRWGTAAQLSITSNKGFTLALLLPTLFGPVALGLLIAGAWPLWPLAAVVAVDALLYRLFAPQLARSSAQVVAASGQLSLIASLARQVEHEAFNALPRSQRLRELAAQLGGGAGGAAAAIAALDRRVVWLEAMKNAFFVPFGLLLLWPLNLGLSVERWRARHGAQIGQWLESIGELEALSSLATYAFERPDDPFAEIIGGDDVDSGIVRGVGLRHPLLEACVPNDIELGGETSALIISGSNMSGKSTYLRTVGCNVVLALAGAPVHAERLELTPLRLGATLRIEDSLAAGRSRFFAELARLKQLVDIADDGGTPLLFLLDEVLAGTNSGDRQRGALLLLDALLSRDAIGLVTTHDLAIAESARTHDALQNCHFSDELAVGPDGPLPTFDYRLRDGIVEGSNALALMRAIGITQTT